MKALLIILALFMAGCSTKKAFVATQNRKDVREYAQTLEADKQEALKPLDIPAHAHYVKKGLSDVSITPTGTVVCQGKWQKELFTVIHSSPCADDKHVYIQTTKNELICFDKATGHEVWKFNGMASEVPTLPIGSTPVIKGQYIVAAFDSGEINVFDKNNSAIVWSDMALSSNMFYGQSPQITADPLIEGDNLYIVSNMPYMAKYNIHTGQKMWSREIGSKLTPLLAGSYMFVLSNDGYCYAVNKNTGKIRWQQKVEGIEGLMLNNRKLYIKGQKGSIVINPTNGQIESGKPS